MRTNIRQRVEANLPTKKELAGKTLMSNVLNSVLATRFVLFCPQILPTVRRFSEEQKVVNSTNIAFKLKTNYL